jgi:hypothetical protein
MGHFAKIDDNNTVIHVISGVPVDNYSDTEGQAFINNTLGLNGNWLHTEPMSRLGSLYTMTPIYSAAVPGLSSGIVGPLMEDAAANSILSAGVVIKIVPMRVASASAYRLNHAQPGMVYHEGYDAFIYPQPTSFPSFVLNPDTGSYQPPIEQPAPDGHTRVWDEANVQWTYVMPTSTLHTFWLSAAPDPTTGKIPPGTKVTVNLHSLKGWYHSISATL